MLQNPSNLPSPQEIDHIEEPMVKANIMIPNDYVGSIMELCQQRRGTMLHMEYITPTRVQLRAICRSMRSSMTSSSTLKSKTRGYGSLEYEFDRYEKSQLVKLDIMLNRGWSARSP